MRFFVRAAIPTVGGNRAILRGQLAPTLDEIVQRLKPEATFYKVTETGPAAGVKAMSMIISLDDATQIKTTVEPLFQALEAKLEYEPVLSPDDLTRVMPNIERDVKKYGDDGRAG